MTVLSGDATLARILVVVPAYQEVAAIAEVVAQVRAAGHDLVVVDDGSSDRTGEVARAAGAVVIGAPFNLGVGAAVRIGLLYGLRHGYDVVVQVDGDGQHDPAAVPLLVAALADADVVVGSRFLGGKDSSAMPVSWWRRRLMAFLAWAVGLVCRTRLTDVTSGFRATGPRALELFARHYPAEYLGDTVESLVIAHRAGLRLAEVAVGMRARAAGRPSQSLPRAALYFSRALLVLFLAVIRSHPEVRATARRLRQEGA